MKRSPQIHLLYFCFEILQDGSAAATHVRGIVEGLRQQGFQVTLVHPDLSARSGAGEAFRKTSFSEKLFRYLALYRRAIVHILAAEMLYIRSHFAAFPIAFIARLLRKPVFHEINGAYDDALVTHPRYARFKRVLGLLQRWQYRQAAGLIAVTPALVAWAQRESGHSRVHLVGNGADTDRFGPDGPVYGHDRPYVLFFGGLVRWHGIEIMLAAARSPFWPEGLDLVIAGPIIDAALRPMLEDAPSLVMRLGPIPHRDLPPLIRGALATLVPITNPAGRSSHGVLPIKLFEGLACGVPAIVTDLPGQADLVREGDCGLVVAQEDPEALVRAVARFHADPDLARHQGQNGARLIAKNHSWALKAHQTAVILRSGQAPS